MPLPLLLSPLLLLRLLLNGSLFILCLGDPSRALPVTFCPDVITCT